MAGDVLSVSGLSRLSRPPRPGGDGRFPVDVSSLTSCPPLKKRKLANAFFG
jgi:hypothetical protein